MRPQESTAPLHLGELLRVAPLADAEAVHLPDPDRPVHEVVLAQTFDRLHRIPPHALVVLHDEAAAGGWSLAAALHVGWERNAVAVVVPPAAVSSSSAVLAQRLGVAVLVVDDDPVDLALTLAGQLSAPAATRALRVARCAERLAEQSSVRGVLGLLNRELRPVTVALLVGEAVAAGRASAVSDHPGAERIRVEVTDPSGRRWGELVASVPAGGAAAAGPVEPVLRLARPPLVAAWAHARVHSAARADQERATFRLFRRMSSSGGVHLEPDGEVDAPSWTDELGWHVDGANRAVWISPARPEDVETTPELTELVRVAWQRHLGDWPVVADGDGWVSWHSGADADDLASTRQAVRAATVAARRHGLVLGVGGAHRGIPGLMRSVTEARLAAHAALDAGPGSVQWFDQVGARAALAWLPRAQIAHVADLCLTDLMAARDRDVLVRTVLAVLDCGGSLSQASARLGVHRNTVLSRVARARELGLTLDDPTQRLALHVLCYALA
ncbi:PucR family transcriptional regulator [Pseudonocardia acaciae]|uniref:PucR family transcriptional regulator n=1 Tax=Pseudonocardia acaciae TaxID=551276 RepID=UPI0006883ED5|nr:helix-turn-helix domain-containing protein [Pseudonocardia acaciae]